MFVGGFEILDGRGVNNLALVDDGGVARQPKAEMSRPDIAEPESNLAADARSVSAAPWS
jgi:hypothetical protein